MKKGFTLVELLGVIVIVALLSLVVVPKITERFNVKQVEASEMAKEILYSATREYISSHPHMFDTQSEYYCVSLKDLVDDGKLTEPVIDVSTGSNLSLDTKIEVVYNNNQYGFDYNTERCSS